MLYQIFNITSTIHNVCCIHTCISSWHTLYVYVHSVTLTILNEVTRIFAVATNLVFWVWSWYVDLVLWLSCETELLKVAFLRVIDCIFLQLSDCKLFFWSLTLAVFFELLCLWLGLLINLFRIAWILTKRCAVSRECFQILKFRGTSIFEIIPRKQESATVNYHKIVNISEQCCSYSIIANRYCITSKCTIETQTVKLPILQLMVYKWRNRISILAYSQKLDKFISVEINK